MTKSDKSFYVTACSSTPKGGIYRYHLAGSEWIYESFAFLEGANYICFSPNGKYLYATFNGECGGGVAAFRILQDGSLKFINKLAANGKSTCHLTCSPNGNFVFAANYLTGSLAVFSIAEDGSVKELIQLIQHTGSGPRKDRQECAHVHCTRITPDKKYLAVVDLGIDSIFMYPLNDETGICNSPKVFHADPADGPRHILFDKSGKTAYVINELGNSVTSCSYLDGVLTQTDKVSTLPDHCDAVTKAAAIRLSADEKWLYASNRGYDSIAIFKVVEPGKLELADIADAHGISPRDINFVPGGEYFTASNEFSDNIALFRFNAESGLLKYAEDADLRCLPRPLCIEYQ